VQQNANTNSDFRPLLQSEIETAKSLGHPLSEEFLLADGVADIFAGTDTTSTALILTLREIFLNQDVYTKLHEELKRVMPTPTTTPRLVELEGLPYLTACVKVSAHTQTSPSIWQN
jgi:cytochrome P450